jgi:hypothetical protein
MPEVSLPYDLSVGSFWRFDSIYNSPEYLSG